MRIAIVHSAAAAAILFHVFFSAMRKANILIATLKRNRGVVEMWMGMEMEIEIHSSRLGGNLIMIMSFALENHNPDTGNDRMGEQLVLLLLPLWQSIVYLWMGVRGII